MISADANVADKELAPAGSIFNYAGFIGLRYSFSAKRNRFTSVIALVSMLGMVLGVATLITVLSVMNGFAGELRGRILSLVPHGYVSSVGDGIDGWQALAAQLSARPDVVAVSPYISEKVILGSSRLLRGAVLTAIDPVAEAGVSDIPNAIVNGSLEALNETRYSVVLGAALARILGVIPGDTIQVTVPRLTVTPLGIFPRSKRLTVVGLFEVGAQPDSLQAYVSLATGQKLLGRAGAVDGLQVETTGLMEAPEIMASLAAELDPALRAQDWSQTQGSLFQAVKMEKIMVSLLLLSVVVVAAFNIVSTLVMSVAEKRRDIAVLRTMGAQARGIMVIFVSHGLALAAVGIGVGATLGILLSTYVAQITATLERLFDVKLFDPSVYFISQLPANLQWMDVIMVVVVSLLLSLLAMVYPAWRAAQIAPAEVLRYE